MDSRLDALLGGLSPVALRRALHLVAQDARKMTSTSMANQLAPDGQLWDPRRPRRGHVTRAKMMRKLRRRYLDVVADGDNVVSVGWSGRAGDVAATHHYGGVDRAAHGRQLVDYPRRELIGVTPDLMLVARRILMSTLDR